MAPSWFNADNQWINSGAQTLKTLQSADLQVGFEGILWPTTDLAHEGGQHAGAGAILGESVHDPSGHLGDGGPTLTMRGVHVWGDGSVTEVLGSWSNQTDKAFDDTGNAIVTLVSSTPAEPYYPYPPYPVGENLPMTHVLLGLDFPGGPYWGNGSARWVGSFYMELYYIPPRHTGGGGVPPVVEVPCPPRPPWPYTDPVVAITANPGGQIRRSRP